MKRYIIRCADFTCCLALLTYGEKMGGQLPIGITGINLYPLEEAEYGVHLFGRCEPDGEYALSIISHLFASKFGYPPGVYSVLLSNEASTIVIDRQDAEACKIKIGKCEQLFTKEYKAQNGVALCGTDVECDKNRVRIFTVFDSSAFEKERLRCLSVMGAELPSDVSVAISAKDNYVSLSCPCHPIPSYVIRAVSHYVSENIPSVRKICDDFTSTVYSLHEGEIILPVWCGEVV